jgi:uncharacterized membrane protein YphA (DoxX/SURF4 family)
MSRTRGRVPSSSQRKAGGGGAAVRRAAAPRPASSRSGSVVVKRPALTAPRSRLRGVGKQAGGAASEWGPTVSRVLLGLVLAWFGYHELVRPGLWTGYVPVLSPSSALAVILVLAHGWVLLMLAVALVAGIAPRAAAALAAVTLFEIVISLWVVGGLSDLVLRDIGVFGLAVALTGSAQHRLVLR